MYRCDQDGVPKIVQSFSLGSAQTIEARLFNGNTFIMDLYHIPGELFSDEWYLDLEQYVVNNIGKHLCATRLIS